MPRPFGNAPGERALRKGMLVDADAARSHVRAERSPPVDALKLLAQQHEEVKELFNEFESIEEEEQKRSLFEEIADDLAAHAEIEEKLFYPTVYVGALKQQLRQAVEEHLTMKRVLADLMELSPSDESFEAKMKVLQEEVEHHVEEEEKDLFPKVRKNFASTELDSLGAQMESMFEELKQNEPRQNVPAETDVAARLE